MKHMLLSASLITLGLAAGEAAAEPTDIAVTMIVEHPSLLQVYKGLKDGLNEKGLKEGEDVTFEFQSAQGQPSIASQIARQFAGGSADVLVTISTPSTQTMASTGTTKPIVFAAVTNPVAAGVVASRDTPRSEGVAGVSHMPNPAQQLDFAVEMMPELERLGILYNPGESNSVAMVESLEAEAEKRGLEVVIGHANRSAEAASAINSIVGKVDMIYVPLDNTMVSAMDAVAAIARSAKVPLITADNASVAKGALAAAGYDHHAIGVQAADLVAQVIEGASPQELPLYAAESLEIVVNPETAEAIGFDMPEEIVNRARSD